MRVVAIGLGGAGCRIVDKLYATDRRSSKVACVQGLAIDVDETTLKKLGGLTEQGKIFFPALDFQTSSEESGSHTATIDIGEIVSRVQNFEAGETDAIIICCGLGGSMVDVAPHIIAALRSSVVEPIFGLVTLPCLAEGERKSSKAADDIDMLQSLLDGIILFDNETWYKKIIAEKAHLKTREKGFGERLGLTKGEKELSPAQATYALLNEGIVRRISLILRAGEFKADGGIDLAEVVLDSGEVLNTMKGMGFITIGYAVERLPADPFSFLSKLKPASIFDEEQKKKASRIVELAKQAIYHEISTPCDMTSAHKALVLIAGPSHELSMKGFMTVRKWIDRSIAGLETRSGDYPVMNTKNVAIIIMLSGLENIPRITEIQEIRAQFKSNRPSGQVTARNQLTNPKENEIEDGIAQRFSVARTDSIRGKDEMIILPVRQRNESSATAAASELSYQQGQSHHDTSEDIDTQLQVEKNQDAKNSSYVNSEQISSPRITQKTFISDVATPLPSPKERETTEAKKVLSPPSRMVITQSTDRKATKSSNPPSHQEISPYPQANNQPLSGAGSGKTVIQNTRSSDAATRSTDLERQLIVRELQRQRVIATSAHTRKVASTPHKHLETSAETLAPQQAVANEGYENPKPKTEQLPHKRVLVSRKSERSPVTESIINETNGESKPGDTGSGEFLEEHNPAETKKVKVTDIGIKEPSFKAKDGVFDGKIVRKTNTPHVRDSGLIHTDIMSRKLTERIQKPDDEHQKDDKTNSSSGSSRGSEEKKPKHDDISWI